MNSQTFVDSTNACLEAFQKLLPSPDLSDETIQKQFARFNYWAANIGVFAPPRVSLDTRLSYKNGANYRRLLLQLLDVLEKNLCAAAKNPEDSKLNDGGVSNKDLIQAVDDIISSLHRLSATIRRAAVRDRNSKVANFIEKDEEGENINIVFQENITRIIKLRFPDASEALCEKLEESISLRRRRVLYSRRHQVKLAVKPRVPAPIQRIIPVVLPDIVPQALPATSTYDLVHQPLPEPTPVAMSVGPSETDPSIPDSDAAGSAIAPSRASSASTGSIIQDENMKYPPAPRLDPRTREASCPYCAAVLTKDEVLSTKLWRRHLKRDIEPFVCTAELCGGEIRFFNNFKIWLKHIQQEHRLQWHCTMATHRPIAFSSREEFETHMSTEHKGKLNQSQLATLVRRGARPATHAFDECPLCKAQAEDVNGEKHFAEDVVVNDRLPRHVAGHLKTLALMFLPLSSTPAEEESNETGSSTKKSSRSVEADSIFELSLTFDDEASSKEDHDDTDWEFLPRDTYKGHDQDPTLKTFIVRQLATDPELSRLKPEETHPKFKIGILQTLQYRSMTDRYETIQKAYPGTFEWVYGDITPWSNFNEWLLCGSGVYWIYGKPASGKSTLLKFISDNMKTRHSLNIWASNSSMDAAGKDWWSQHVVHPSEPNPSSTSYQLRKIQTRDSTASGDSEVLTMDNESSSPWVLPIFMLPGSKSLDEYPVPKRAQCTLDAGNQVGNIVSREFLLNVLKISESKFEPLRENEKRGYTSYTAEPPLFEGAIYLTWYTTTNSAKVFRDMRFLISPNPIYDLIIGADSIMKHQILKTPKLSGLGYALPRPGQPNAGETESRFQVSKAGIQDAGSGILAGDKDAVVLTAAFFFWKFGTPLNRTENGMLRSLLFQILGQHPTLASPVLERLDFDHRFPSDDNTLHENRWDTERLRHAFHNLLGLASPRLRFCFFIASLNECDGFRFEDAPYLQSKNPFIKFCISSRPLVAFQDAFGKSPSLKLEDLTKPDIEGYVTLKLNENPHQRRLLQLERNENQAASLIRDIIAKNANGVFLWVILVTRSILNGLRNGDTMEDIKRRVHMLPPDLEEIYKGVISIRDLNPQQESPTVFSLMEETRDAELIYCVNSWHADRGATFSVAMEHLSRLLQERTGGLIELHYEGETRSMPWQHAKLAYIHHTAKDFVGKFTASRLSQANAKEALLKGCALSLDLLHQRHLNHTAFGMNYIQHRWQEVCWFASSMESTCAERQVIPLWDFDKSAAGLASWIGWTSGVHWSNFQRPGRWRMNFLDALAEAHLWLPLRRILQEDRTPLHRKPGSFPLLAFTFLLTKRNIFNGDMSSLSKVLAVLFEFGANPNDEVLAGYTTWQLFVHMLHTLAPLLHKAQNNHVLGIFKLFLNAGADPHITCAGESKLWRDLCPADDEELGGIEVTQLASHDNYIGSNNCAFIARATTNKDSTNVHSESHGLHRVILDLFATQYETNEGKATISALRMMISNASTRKKEKKSIWDRVKDSVR